MKTKQNLVSPSSSLQSLRSAFNGLSHLFRFALLSATTKGGKQTDCQYIQQTFPRSFSVA